MHLIDDDLRQAVLQASVRPEVREAVGRVYAQLQTAIDQRKPICVASGKCCRFEEYGHRLYVTTLELAMFVAERSVIGAPQIEGAAAIAHSAPRSLTVLEERPRPISNPIPPGCPYQVSGLCSVHAIRPFGCRVFFCDATSTQWQQDQYEQHHATLRRLHEELGVAYFYVEWRFALRVLEEK